MKRTTMEIDERLLERAKRALGKATARATVEEALKRAADAGDAEHSEAIARQRRFFKRLGSLADIAVMSSEAMWQ